MEEAVQFSRQKYARRREEVAAELGAGRETATARVPDEDQAAKGRKPKAEAQAKPTVIDVKAKRVSTLPKELPFPMFAFSPTSDF